MHQLEQRNRYAIDLDEVTRLLRKAGHRIPDGALCFPDKLSEALIFEWTETICPGLQIPDEP